MKQKKYNGNKSTDSDLVKASRRGSREAEIELYGRPLPKSKVHKSRKVYDRKKSKAGLRDLPFDYVLYLCSFM